VLVSAQEGAEGTFDFIFIDANKRSYDAYYEKSLKLLRQGGLCCIDNVLWHGRVAEIIKNENENENECQHEQESRQRNTKQKKTKKRKDNMTKAITELNKKLHADERVEICLLPVCDGMFLAMKR
jgi:predicted O-methyltransferase YrrM